MHEEALRSELNRVSAELAAALTDRATLDAKIVGLTAQESALTKTLQLATQGEAGSAPAQGYRTDAIVAVLAEAAKPLGIRDVLAGLRNTGRSEEAYENVGVDLAYLAERGRITRVKRGVYATAVRHRSVQHCSNGHEFMWQPSPGACPYCTLTTDDRISGLQQSAACTECPADCCEPTS